MAEPVYDLEFNGPFADWWNVVDDFGADPTGVADSTAAFEAMISTMCTNDGGIKSGRYAGFTGYIPNGTYKISRPLRLPDKNAGTVSGEGVNLWGQDPVNTILKWNVPNWNPEMLWSDGCHSSVIARITFDGGGVASTGIRLERDPDISVNNSYSRIQDCIFKDLGAGFRQTDYVPGTGTDSEFSILRCRFYRCSDFGVNVTAGDAYNYWVRQCYFEDCSIGIGNGPSGAFNAYDNVFVRSTNYDIYATAMRICGIRRNRSFDSKRFLYLNCSNAVIEGNGVSNPTETDAVQLANRFKVMILNNRFKSASGTTIGPVIKETVNPFLPYPFNEKIAPFAPLFILLNQFTVTDPIGVVPQTPTSSDIQDNMTNPSLTVEMPPLPPFPPQVIRQTWYLDAEDDPQQTIDDAAAYALAAPSSQPVVYLPTYASPFHDKSRLNRTLIFPANVKMSLQGGGNRAAFRWDAATRETYQDPYVLFRGPSKVTVQNMQLGFSYAEGGKKGLMAVVDSCDQPGSRFYSDNGAGIYQFRALANLKADVCDFVIGSYNTENLPFLVSSPSEGTGDSRVLHEGGAGGDSAGNEPFVRLLDGGRYYLRDFWYETTNTDKLWASLEGMGARAGKFVVEASLIEQHTSPEGWKMKAIEATDWWGDILYLDSLIIGTTKFSGDASRASYESFGGGSPLRSDSSQPATFYRQDGIPYWIIDFWTMSLTMESFENNSGWGVFGAKPETWQEPLWDTANRAPITWIDVLPPEVTDVRLHRVRGDILFLSEPYILVEELSLVQTTDFMSAVLPSDAIFTRESSATEVNSKTLIVYGPENLCPYSQDFIAWSSMSAGTGTNPVLTPNDAVAPDGTTTACKAVFDCGSGGTSADTSFIRSLPIDIFVGSSNTFYLWLKGDPGTQIWVYVLNYEFTFTCDGTWRQFGIINASYNDPAHVTFDIGVNGTINNTATVWIWGTQVERYDVFRSYIKTTATPAYGLRFDHDPLTGTLLGGLVEPASANACGNSWRLTATGWSSTGVTVADNALVSPGGQQNAATITEDNATSIHECEYNTVNVINGATYGLSCLVKNVAGSRWLQLSLGGGQYFNFNPSTGNVGNSTGVTNIAVLEMTNGWWRIGGEFTASGTGGTSIRLYLADSSTAGGGPSYPGDGASAISVWGVQFDSTGIGVTSYIPARDGPYARNADILNILRADGTYEIEIVRQNGTELLSNQTITNGSFAVPTNISPVIKVVTRCRPPQSNTWTFDFLSGVLPPTASLTRADASTCASYYDSAGILQVAAANVPRFTHNPVTLALQGLLVEPERSNLVLASSAYPANWTNGNTFCVADQTTGPDGTVTAEKFYDANTTTPQVYQALSLTDQTQYTWSLFAKRDPASPNPMNLALLPQAGGVLSTDFYACVGDGTAYIAGTADAGGIDRSAAGFYRCWVVDTATATGTGYHQFNLATDTNVNITAHDSAQALFVWGAQLEKGDGPSSYIPTTTVAVTRAADVLTLAVPNGTYTATLERVSGNTTLPDQVVTTGAYTVPTSTSPLRRVILQQAS